MRALCSLVCCVAVSGCAAHQVVPQRLISTSWSTVSSLPPGTEVGVALADDETRYGRISDVSEQSLTLWERHGAATIARGRVARLAVRTSTGSSRAPNVIKWSLIGAVITGAIGGVASAIDENPGPGGGKWLLLFGGIAAGAAIGSQQTPVERFREQVIYIRP